MDPQTKGAYFIYTLILLIFFNTSIAYLIYTLIHLTFV